VILVSRNRAAVAGRVIGLMTVGLLQAYWFLQPVPLTAKGLIALFLAVSLWRPTPGVLAFAGLAPLSTLIAKLCGAGPALGGQLLEQMALSVGAGVLIRSRWAGDRTRIGAPATFMAVVAIASAVAMIPTFAAPFARGIGDSGPLLHELAARWAAEGSPVWGPLFRALVIAECGLLAWAAERTVRREPALAGPIVSMALIGHAAAAVLNLQALVGDALRTGSALGALPRLLMTERISLQTDLNAGASALVLAGVAGAGLLTGSWSRRIGIGVLLLLVAMGIWITGSRIAFGMGAGAFVLAIGWWAVHAGRRTRLTLGGIGLLVLGMGAWLVVTNPAGRNYPLSNSISGRLAMARTGVQMFKQAPVFGIGITQFYPASEAFDDPYRRALVGGTRENAHNNFIQVLAEQGLAGLGALLWSLAVVLVGAQREQKAIPNAIRASLLLGIVACLGTWLTGHPLLVPEFAFVFWLYCGVLAAMTAGVPSTRSRWLVWVLVTAVIASVPLRASAQRNAALLEHFGFGVSLWQHDDAQPYREVGTSFALFLPAGTMPVDVPVRRAPGTPDPVVVDVTIRGELIDRISVRGDGWQSMLVPVRQGARRFELVEFAVKPPAPGIDAPKVLLRVGKDSVR
jgi:O-antigen ligase